MAPFTPSGARPFQTSLVEGDAVVGRALKKRRVRFCMVGDDHQPNSRGLYMFIWMFPKIGGNTPKWMVKIMANPIKMDDLVGFPIIFELTPIYRIPIIRIPCYRLDDHPQDKEFRNLVKFHRDRKHEF